MTSPWEACSLGQYAVTFAHSQIFSTEVLQFLKKAVHFTLPKGKFQVTVYFIGIPNCL